MKVFAHPHLSPTLAFLLLSMFTVAYSQSEHEPAVLVVQLRAEKNRVRFDEKFKLVFQAKNTSGRDILITSGEKPGFSYKHNSSEFGLFVFFFPNDHLAVFPNTIEIKAGQEVEFTESVSMNDWNNEWNKVTKGVCSIDATIGYAYKDELEANSSTSEEELREQASYKPIGTETPKKWIMGWRFKELQWFTYTNKVELEVFD